MAVKFRSSQMLKNRFKSIRNPHKHGDLKMSDRLMNNGYDFTQEDLNKGRIKVVAKIYHIKN